MKSSAPDDHPSSSSLPISLPIDKDDEGQTFSLEIDPDGDEDDKDDGIDWALVNRQITAAKTPLPPSPEKDSEFINTELDQPATPFRLPVNAAPSEVHRVLAEINGSALRAFRAIKDAAIAGVDFKRPSPTAVDMRQTYDKYGAVMVGPNKHQISHKAYRKTPFIQFVRTIFDGLNPSSLPELSKQNTVFFQAFNDNDIQDFCLYLKAKCEISLQELLLKLGFFNIPETLDISKGSAKMLLLMIIKEYVENLKEFLVSDPESFNLVLQYANNERSNLIFEFAIKAAFDFRNAAREDSGNIESNYNESIKQIFIPLEELIHVLTKLIPVYLPQADPALVDNLFDDFLKRKFLKPAK